MKLADLPDDLIIAFLADGTIGKVEISRKNKEWSMTIILPKLVPWNIYETVCRKISDSLSHIARIRLAVRYPDGVSDELLVREYWPLFIQKMLQEAVPLKGWLARAAAEVQGRRVTVKLPDPLGLELCRKKQMDKKLERFFRERFQRRFQVLLRFGENIGD
jgi:DNA polymerase-3 subunit alpha (Gram-positive type)